MKERPAPGERERRLKGAAGEMLAEYRGPFGPGGPAAAGRALERRETGEEEEEEGARKDHPRLDGMDILAFIIGFFQLLLPPFLVMAGVLVLLYLLIRLWAGV